EKTTDDASPYSTTNTGSNRVKVEAVKLGIHQMWSAEMEEDSIIPYVLFLRRQASLALAHYSDSLVLNGDDTNGGSNINSDGASPSGNEHYLAFNGLRHVGLVDNTAMSADVGGTPDLDDLMKVKGRMVDYEHFH